MQLSCLCGSSLAPVFGGFLYTVGGFKLPFIIMGLVLLCSIGVLAYLLPSETGFTTVIGSVLYSFMQPILAPHLRSLGQNAAQIGFAFFLFAGVNIISALVLGFIADKMKCYRSLLLFGLTTFSIGYLLLGPAPFLTFFSTDDLWLIHFALAFNGLVIAFYFQPLLPEILKVARDKGMPDNEETKAQLSSIYTSMAYLGLFIGPSLGGTLAEHFGFAWALTIAALMGFAQALILLIFTLVENVSRGSNLEEEKLSLLS